MQIQRITTKVLERDMGGHLFNPSRRWSTKTMVLVFIEGEDGKVGLGEVWASGASASALTATIERDIAPLVVDTNAHAFPRVWHDIYRSSDHSSRPGIVTACLGAVDMAIWDLLAKHYGMPLYQYLGACRETVPCYGSAGLYGNDKTAEDLAAEMLSYVDQGIPRRENENRRTGPGRGCRSGGQSPRSDWAGTLPDDRRGLQYGRALGPAPGPGGRAL